MKVALVTIIRPVSGSGDGITEYTYQLFKNLHTRIKVGLVYSLERPKRNDILGLLKSNVTFGDKVSGALNGRYDVVHITNHEAGFLAKKIKENDRSVPVVTTIHDLLRFSDDMNRGLFQKAYNKFVRNSIDTAVRYSDFLIFNSSQTRDEVNLMFKGLDRSRQGVILHGIDGRFFGKMPPKRGTGMFTVGYIGSLAYHKNVRFVLSTALHLKNEGGFRFEIYGTGNTIGGLAAYKRAHWLENVTLRGFALDKKMVDIYDSFDAFIFPSRYEGFGFPILEAQSRGLPVVIYKNSKIPKEVRRHCFEAKDEVDAARMLKSLKEKGYDSRLKKKAMSYARSFTWERAAENTIKVYKSL